jgi:FdrA protein
VTASAIRVIPGAYRDSLLLLNATRVMTDNTGVSWASAAMANPVVVADLAVRGFASEDLAGADANALVLAARAADGTAAESAVSRGLAVLFPAQGEPGEPATPGRAAGEASRLDQPGPRTVAAAVARLRRANVAVVSVPGDYAALTAHRALSAGLHVLLFSDNVSISAEVELKERARRLGRLVMGPGAGTAFLGGVGLGFANAVRPGPVGVLAAAGTGAQEVMALLDHWDIGVSHVIGVGGRDLTAAVGGLMAREAIGVLDADPDTEAIVLVSKPPDPAVASAVIGAAATTPVIAACLGLNLPDGVLAGAPLAPTLEQAAHRVAGLVGTPVPGLTDVPAEAVERAIGRIGAGRTAVRGFFTGGTLCYEAQVVLGERLGPVYSNIPLRPELGLPAPPGAHTCLDLGEEEYTSGRPHPMIDPAARIEIMRSSAFDPEIAAVIVDVVIGFGSHPDPAGAIADLCADIVSAGAAVVAYVLGARGDRQGIDEQRHKLAEAGVINTRSCAQAARVAAAIAARRPALATAAPW